MNDLTTGDIVECIDDTAARPESQIMPNLGGLDISPIILILIIMFIQRVITYYIYPSVF